MKALVYWIPFVILAAAGGFISFEVASTMAKLEFESQKREATATPHDTPYVDVNQDTFFVSEYMKGVHDFRYEIVREKDSLFFSANTLENLKPIEQ